MPRLHYPPGQRCERAAGAAPLRFVPRVLPRGDGSTPVRFSPAGVCPPLAGFFFGGLQVVHEDRLSAHQTSESSPQAQPPKQLGE